MVPRTLSFLHNKTPPNARYRKLLLLSCRFLFSRNQTSFLTTRNLLIERNGAFYYRFYEPIHLLESKRFNIPKYSFRCYTGSDSPKPTISYTISDLSQDTYHRLSEIALEYLLEYFENLDDRLNISAFDVEYSSGVLTLKCGTSGVYVLNKQPPNKQIWLSSPISGPKRYDFDSKHKKWFYHRDNSTLDGLLNEELSTVFGAKIDISVPTG
ncbi:Frataxin [Rhizophagus irregularis]|uniref:ferroxidase n=1 Tax=Rhizophagus irregularis TaxID=588596 RepID=A0A2N0SG80_9GLOM|nr:Frataxin [Rhizophagus irregularis]